MKTVLVFCFCFFATETLTAKVSTTTQTDTLVIINEVMYYPVSPFVEFIELFNISQTDSVRLNGFKLGDSNTLSAIEDSGKSIYLKPQQFAVVFGKNRFAAGTSLYNIPAAALRLSVKSADIGNGLNNSGDTVILTDSIGTVLQTFTYLNGASLPNFTLEKILPTRNNSSSNWQRSLDSLGTAGRRNSVTPFTIDLKNQSLHLSPSDSVVFGTSVTLNDTVKNIGLTTVSNFSVDFFEDANGNGIPEPSEKFQTQTFSGSLPYNASAVVVVAPLAMLSVGIHRFISVINFPSDENHANDTAKATLNIISPPSLMDTSVVLSEIMYDPPVGANGITDEYVEVYNTSADSSIDLQNWKLGTSVLSDTGTGKTILPPKGFGLIFGAGYFSDNYYRNQIPSGILVLKAASALSLTNSGTTVVLLNARGDTLQRYTYGDSTRKGFSLEKILMNRNNAASNWGRSTKQGGTPGSHNTLTPFQFNLSISAPPRVVVLPATPAVIQTTIRNIGTSTFGNGTTVKLFEGKNRNNIAEPPEEIASLVLSQNISPNDSVTRQFTFQPTTDTTTLLIRLINAADEDSTDNTASTKLFRGTVRNAAVINEIMYSPLQNLRDGRPDQPHYIEIFNRSAFPLNLAGWTLGDSPNERGQAATFVISDTAAWLNPNEYAVVSPDTALAREATRLVRFFTALQNSSAKLFFVRGRLTFPFSTTDNTVLLRDATGGVIDSVAFSAAWHSPFLSSTTGVSLEKINPNFSAADAKSWSSCTDKSFGGTPAKQNSDFATSLVPTGSGLVISPNPFSPDGDGHDDNTVIAYKLSGTANRVSLKIFDVKGRLVRTLANSEPSGSSGSFVWNGLDDAGQSLRIGIYLVFLEALNNAAAVQTFKSTVVLARRLK